MRVGLLGVGHGLAHVKLLVEQAQQRQGRALGTGRRVVGGPGSGDQRMQQHPLAGGLARPHGPEAGTALGRFGPTQLGRILDQ